jgi:hypothetical protein
LDAVFRCTLGFGFPWLSRVVTGLSLRRHVFEPRPVVDTVALAQSFQTLLKLFAVSNIPVMFQ